MKVSFLLPDVSCPVLGPVIELAGHLEPMFETEIVGPDLGHGVCEMYRNSRPVRAVPCPRIYRLPNYWPERRRLGAAADGGIIVAVKAFGATVPVALAEKRRRGAKVVVYLDEWDGALVKRLPLGERLQRWVRHAHHPLDDLYCPWVERLIPQCDRVISTTSFLQRKFGGSVVHMGVDTNHFAPQPPDEVAALRKKLGFGADKLIVFGGVVRPHKGIELILDALCKLGRPEVKLLIVGPRNEHVAELERTPRYAPYLRAIGPQAKADMPRYLALGDVAVLPLDGGLLASSQMPCKVFEAMAMARPVIASAVSDLPEVLKDCGWLVPAGDAGAIARALTDVLDHPDAAAKAGAAARERCQRLYSREVTRRQLQRIFTEVKIV